MQQTAAQPEVTKHNSLLSLMDFKPIINQADTLINWLLCALAGEESISAPRYWSGSVVILKYRKYIYVKAMKLLW